MGGFIPKGFIRCKFRLSGRHQPIAFLHIMDTVNGKPPALQEERAQYLSVHSLPGLFLKRFLKHLRLQRIMPTQRGIPSGNKQQLLMAGSRGLYRPFCNQPVLLFGLLCRKASGIGQDEKHIVFLLYSLHQAFLFPICINRYTMNRLDPGRIIIQHHDFPVEIP